MSDLSVFVLADCDEQRRRERRDILAGEELCIHEAAFGREALELAALHRPDAILLDLDLADPDGLEVYSRLKADANFTSPVILSIPRSAPDRKAVALAQGAEAYLVEPVELEVFAAAVRSTLRLGQAERERSALGARLRAAQSEIEQFAAQLCHDVEEPLRAVTTFVQIVEERQGALAEPERGYLEHVLAASARVRCLLRGFLSYAQAGRGRRAHFGRLDLRAAAAAAVQSLRKRVEESRSEIVIEEPWPTVWADFGQLQQVFEQVLRNAIDYHAPQSAARVTLSAKRGDGDEWVVLIADNGAGVATDFQASIFLPFKRLHGREIPGAGMGLAICRKIVEAHGGRMWVESQPGAGASFYFTLRAFETAEKAAR
jgi:light-regulated signal transduction histidine kinase (bacteriophytochrome)